MNKKNNWINTLTLLRVLLIIGLNSYAFPANAADDSEFILLYSNDIHGEIEPCG